MADVLIVVERSASEHPDIIATTILKDFKDYISTLNLKLNEIPVHLREAPVELVPNHGMAGTVSLTSVVLATAARKAGLSCAIFDDDDIISKHNDRFCEAVREAKVIAFSTTYIVARRHIANLVQAIRDESDTVPILLGGQGVPSLKLDPYSPADQNIFSPVNAVFYGDAENDFAKICRDLIDGDLSTPPSGALYKQNEKWTGSTIPQQVDLNAVDIPDYGILKSCRINGAYLPDDFLPDYASLEEGRGCAFRCRFCSYHVFSPFRRKSPERVVAEMSAVKAQGFDNASFVGAEFIAPIKESSAVLRAIRDANLGMQIWLYARLDLLSRHPEMFDLLRDAGVKNLVFGMESGDKQILKNMKKFYDIEGMEQGAHKARKMGFELMSSIIIGYPGETAETIKATSQVLVNCNFDQVFLHALNILPDTALWDLREEFGIKISKTGFWKHNTMALNEIPQATRNMITEVHNNSDSNFINVIRTLTPGFVRPGSGYTNDTLHKVSRIIQDILSHEWAGEPSDELRRENWTRLTEASTQLPKYILNNCSN